MVNKKYTTIQRIKKYLKDLFEEWEAIEKTYDKAQHLGINLYAKHYEAKEIYNNSNNKKTRKHSSSDVSKPRNNKNTP